MNSNSTLLIDLSPNGKIKIIDLNEILDIEKYFLDVFLYIDKSNYQPSHEVVNNILNSYL